MNKRGNFYRGRGRGGFGAGFFLTNGKKQKTGLFGGKIRSKEEIARLNAYIQHCEALELAEVEREIDKYISESK